MYYLIKSIILLLSLLPFRVLYFLSDFFYLLVYYVFKYRREVVRTNLENSFPEKTAQERLEIEKKFYRHFSDLFVEVIKFTTLSKKEMFKRIIITNKELINIINREKKSFITYSSHLGNWEWLPIFNAHFECTVTTFYEPLHNKLFDRIMKSSRQRFGTIPIPSNLGLKKMIEYKKNNQITLTNFIADQSPKLNSEKYWTTFLNQETAFLVGVDRISRKLNQEIYFFSFYKVKRGFYELTIEKIENQESKDPNKNNIIERYVKLLEKAIRRQPEIYIWSHRRWKYNREN